MEAEEVAVPAFLSTTDFLTAKELVALRTAAEETPQPVIGEKFNISTDSLSEKNAVMSALENFRDLLEKQRTGRICDLMKAEWNPELNTVTVSKLKGKFTQHMGRIVNGNHVLSPEEAVFLLENNCIEILHNKIPMSMEEAFTKILKGNLGLEKYEVYSHLSKLGYIVVLHEAEAGITEYERAMNLDKHPMKKRQIKEPSEGEPEKKRLTFTGALSEESEMKTTSDASKKKSSTFIENETGKVCPITSEEETGIPEGREGNVDDNNFDSERNGDEQNSNEVFIHKVTENIQHNVDEMNHTSVSNGSLVERCENNHSEVSKEIISACDSESAEENGNAAETGENTKSNGMDSQIEMTENNKLQNDLSLRNNENEDSFDYNCGKEVDVMNVDTDTESSNSTVEITLTQKPSDNFKAFYSNVVNATSQDPCISEDIEDNQNTANTDSNFDVMSTSSYSMADEEDEVLTVDADNPSKEEDDDEEEEAEIILIEVTKEEKKPLAVIDLLSDDDDDKNDKAESVNIDDYDSNKIENVDDDDITFLEEHLGPSTDSSTSRKKKKKKKSSKLKKEGVLSSSSQYIPPLTVSLPDMFRTRDVCIERPPLHLLPNHSKPSKEVYILNTKVRYPRQSSNNRVWNSFRDLPDLQRHRHENNMSQGRSFYASQVWNDWNGRSYMSRNNERSNMSSLRSDRVNFPDGNYNSRSYFGRPPADFSRNVLSVNSYQNNISLPPNPATMNCEVAIKEDNGEGMVSSSSQSHSNNYSFSPDMPNNPPKNQMIPNNNFMAGIQEDAFHPNNVSPNFNSMHPSNMMAEFHKTCVNVARNVLSNMLMGNNPMMPNQPMSMFPPIPLDPHISNGFNNSHNIPSTNDRFSVPNQNFSDQTQRFQRNIPFPCDYADVRRKRTWSDIKSAICNSSSDVKSANSNSDSDIEEMPIKPSEILWKDVCPLVKPDVHRPVGNVFNFLQITEKAKVTSKYGYSEKTLPKVSNLEISYDVYLPTFSFKKTYLQIPKYRIVVVKSTDPIPEYSNIAVLQRKWCDDASLMLAISDNGDVSFHSFNSIFLPSLTPHEK